MKISPLVSVVIPCYNHESFVQDSIQSVIDQTYQNIELIIIDDGSKDGSVEKIQEMIFACQARFVRFEFRHRPNKGLSATLNEALEWCKGIYYSAIASDDMMLPGKTKLQVDFLDANRNISAVFGGYDLIDEQNKILLTKVGKDKLYYFEEIFMHDHDLPAPTQMIRMSSLKELNGYREDIIIEDWYMWLKLSEKGQVYYMSEKFSLYRSHGDNTSKKIDIIHNGRLHVISSYSSHPLYNEAVLKVKWIWLSELRAAKSNEYFFNIFVFFLFNPLYTVRKFKKRYLA